MAGTVQYVWLLELGNPVTEYAASDECTSDADYTALGVVYLRRIRDPLGLTIQERLPDVLAGVSPPATATVTLGLSDWTDATPWSTDWRGTKAVLKEYDRTATPLPTATTVFTGIVTEADWGNNACTLSLSSYDTSVLDRQIPARTVNVDEFPSATDLGAPIPYLWGRAYFSPPACGAYDATEDDATARGFDMCLAPVLGRDGLATNQVAVEEVYIDAGAGLPTLELISSWSSGPGSPTFVSTTTFTISSDGTEDAVYSVAANGGKALRWRVDENSAWIYTHVTEYDSGTNTVTVADPVLTDDLANVELLGGDYVHERGRYMVSGRALNTLRFFADTPGAIVVRAYARGGDGTPNEVIRDVLADPVFGLGQTVDASSFVAAGMTLGTADLANAISYALGGDRQQQTARDFLDQVCSVRGMRLSYNGSAWFLAVDSAPSSATITLGYGDGVHDNIVSIRSRRRIALHEAVRRLYLRYGPLGRTVGTEDGATWVNNNGYRYSIYATINARGTDRIVTLPIVTQYQFAKRILCYWARRLRAAEDVLELTAGREALTLSIGDICTVTAPHLGISGTYRVRSRTRRMTSVDLVLEGYDANMYVFDASEIQYENGYGANTSQDAAAPDARTPQVGSPANLLLNADFSGYLRGTSIAPLGDAGFVLPGWYFSNHLDGITVAIIRGTSEALACMGGAYLKVTIATAPRTLQMLDTPDGILAGIAVTPGTLYYASVYSGTYGGWLFEFLWMDVDGVSLIGWQRPNLHRDGSDVNGNDWARIYAMARAPANAARCILRVRWVTTVTDAKYDGFQFEPAMSRQRKPSTWRRSPRYGIDPALLIPGTLTIRGEGELSHGRRIGQLTGTATLSGSSVTISGLIPSHSTVQVTARVTTAITGSGVSGWSLGTSINATLWGSSLALDDGTEVGPNEWNHIGASVSFLDDYASTDIVITPTDAGGTFAAGVVKVTVHYTQLIPPTS
jgi:hypothetical protein